MLFHLVTAMNHKGVARTCSLIVMLLGCINATTSRAQIDLSGEWAARNSTNALQNLPGAEPTPVDYLGLPLSGSGRAHALLMSPDKISMPERICAFYSPIYLLLGPFGLSITNQTEPRNGRTVAWVIGGWEDMAPITVHMDGRKHPSANAPHEMGGFTTGHWEHDVLVTTTTHMRASIFRRNTASSSDQSTMTLWFLRHGEQLTVFGRVEDPIYLSEPLLLTRSFDLGPREPQSTVGQPCVQGDEGVSERAVPHLLPGQNPYIDDVTKQYGIPREAVLGGAQTMYPQYRKQLQPDYKRPKQCERACGGPGTWPRLR